MVEAARVLVEKLIVENAELVEKVTNELSVACNNTFQIVMSMHDLCVCG